MTKKTKQNETPKNPKNPDFDLFQKIALSQNKKTFSSYTREDLSNEIWLILLEAQNYYSKDKGPKENFYRRIVKLRLANLFNKTHKTYGDTKGKETDNRKSSRTYLHSAKSLEQTFERVDNLPNQESEKLDNLNSFVEKIPNLTQVEKQRINVALKDLNTNHNPNSSLSNLNFSDIKKIKKYFLENKTHNG